MEIHINNPFFVAFIIVFVLNIMVFLFYRPAVKAKIYFRSLFYMWIVTTGIFYLHHKKMEEDLKKKLDTAIGTSIVNRTQNLDQMIEPDITPKVGEGEAVNIWEESLLI
jgi:hypothetical protein